MPHISGEAGGEDDHNKRSNALKKDTEVLTVCFLIIPVTVAPNFPWSDNPVLGRECSKEVVPMLIMRKDPKLPSGQNCISTIYSYYMCPVHVNINEQKSIVLSDWLIYTALIAVVTLLEMFDHGVNNSVSQFVRLLVLY